MLLHYMCIYYLLRRLPDGSSHKITSFFSGAVALFYNGQAIIIFVSIRGAQRGGGYIPSFKMFPLERYITASSSHSCLWVFSRIQNPEQLIHQRLFTCVNLIDSYRRNTMCLHRSTPFRVMERILWSIQLGTARLVPMALHHMAGVCARVSNIGLLSTIPWGSTLIISARRLEDYIP